MRTSHTPVRSVVFDMDDTLYPERQYVRSGYAAVAEKLRRTFNRTEPFERWLWDRFCRGQASGAFDELSQEFELDLSAAQIGDLVETYRNHTPQIKPFPAIPSLLAKLHERYRLGLLSDGFLPAQQLKLKAIGLERFFDAVVFTEELGREFWKPSPVGFEKIADLLASPRVACAYVADNPFKDFVAPNALGWRTVQYLHPGQVHSARPAPDGGRPQTVVRLPGELYQALL